MAEQDPWAPYEDKYTIHEETRAFGRFYVASKLKSYPDLGVEKSRKQMLAVYNLISGDVEFDGEDTEIIVPSPYTPEGIPVSVYKPASRPETPAILVFFHGGGLVTSNRNTHATPLKIIARDSGAIVLNVEYRLLPNPDSIYAPFEDCEVVARWVLENKEVVGGKPNSKVGVGGDSAGGQLAIGVTNEIRGLDFQILIVPVADTSMKQDTVQEFKHVILLDENNGKFYKDIVSDNIPDFVTNPRFNGMARTNTALSPPALIILAELDPFRGCGIDYADKLQAAGVKVQLEIFQGIPHVFFNAKVIFETTASQAYNCIVKFLKQFQ